MSYCYAATRRRSSRAKTLLSTLSITFGRCGVKQAEPRKAAMKKDTSVTQSNARVGRNKKKQKSPSNDSVASGLASMRFWGSHFLILGSPKPSERRANLCDAKAYSIVRVPRSVETARRTRMPPLETFFITSGLVESRSSPQGTSRECVKPRSDFFLFVV